MKYRTLGIDPGLSGAMGIVENGRPQVWTPVFRHGPKEDIDWRRVQEWLMEQRVHEVDYVAIERVHSMPGQGVASTFRFGQAYGGMRALVEMSGRPWVLVTPQKWKKEMLRGYDTSSKSSSGEYLMDAYDGLDLRASERARKPHDGISDALCIALWCERQVRMGLGGAKRSGARDRV